jgi:3,4-dihydroxy-2-butanone 4-phosphate synthase
MGRVGTELASGRMVLLRDDRERGGEVDLLVGAEFATAAAINFMAGEARGLLTLALSAERCEALGLERTGPRGGPSSPGDSSMFPIEAREGIGSGGSAADRARTVAVAIDPASTPDDLVRPGHLVALRARPGGVLERAGRIEAAVELTAGAGMIAAAVLCPVMAADGRTARGEELEAFAVRHDLATLTVSEVVEHRRAGEPGAMARVIEAGRRLREVMGHFATGVSVITARDAEGRPIGMTANAISSVSLDPPLLLVCIARGSRTLAAIRADGRFAVNILAAGQRHHSDRFATRTHASRAHEVEFDDRRPGVPMLPEALASAVCEVEAIHPAGDHEIVIGWPVELAHCGSRQADPLLFYRGRYAHLTPGKEGAQEPATLTLGAW